MEKTENKKNIDIKERNWRIVRWLLHNVVAGAAAARNKCFGAAVSKSFAAKNEFLPHRDEAKNRVNANSRAVGRKYRNLSDWRKGITGIGSDPAAINQRPRRY